MENARFNFIRAYYEAAHALLHLICIERSEVKLRCAPEKLPVSVSLHGRPFWGNGNQTTVERTLNGI